MIQLLVDWHFYQPINCFKTFNRMQNLDSAFRSNTFIGKQNSSTFCFIRTISILSKSQIFYDKNVDNVVCEYHPIIRFEKLKSDDINTIILQNICPLSLCDKTLKTWTLSRIILNLTFVLKIYTLQLFINISKQKIRFSYI